MIKKKLVHSARKQQDLGNGGLLERLLASGYEKYRTFRRSLRNIEDPRYSRAFLQARNMKRNLYGRNFKFVTVSDATLWTNEWVQTFPRQYDLIVGVPRSGMLVASIVALRLGKGLTTPELLAQGRYWHSSLAEGKLPVDKMKHILLVDDSVDKGRAMAKAIDQIGDIGKNLDITKAALIVREETKHNADLYYKIIEPPRTFEWNILHRKIASYAAEGKLAVDLDGVLCANLPAGADDDEDWYEQAIENASPYLIPAFEIDVILTCRLEKYRAATEAWLQRHNVRYKELRMWDLPDKSHRNGGFAAYKVAELLRIKPDMFWESSWSQAERIWKETKIPTLCVDEMTMLN